MIKKLVQNRKYFALIVMLLGNLAFTTYELPPTPPHGDVQVKPEYYPLELAITPYGQTVSGNPWHAVWDLYISGGQGTYCLLVIWGDSIANWESCGYTPGNHYTIGHDFNKPGDGAGTYYQTWRISGVGGPVYNTSYVVKQ